MGFNCVDFALIFLWVSMHLKVHDGGGGRVGCCCGVGWVVGLVR